MLTLALFNFAGCEARPSAPGRGKAYPLAKDVLDVAVVGRRVASLRRVTGGAVVTVTNLDGETSFAQFDVPSSVGALAANDVEIVLLVNEPARAYLDVRLSDGSPEGHIAVRRSAFAVAATAERAYVLARERTGLRIVTYDLTRKGQTGATEAPPDAVSIAARGGTGGDALLVGDRGGRIWYRPPRRNDWALLDTPGSDPIFSVPPGAGLALQHVEEQTIVVVFNLPSGLQVRMFPAAADTRRIAETTDGSLLILEHVADSWSARYIDCASPLLAVGARTLKGSAFQRGKLPFETGAEPLPVAPPGAGAPAQTAAPPDEAAAAGLPQNGPGCAR